MKIVVLGGGRVGSAIVRDLAAEEPPELTHVYLFAGSEECGMRGLISQLGLELASARDEGSEPASADHSTDGGGT